MFFLKCFFRSLKASPFTKTVLESFCRFEVRAHVKNWFLLFLIFRPCVHMCKGKWFGCLKFFPYVHLVSVQMDRIECLTRSLFYISAFPRFKSLNSAKFDCGNVFWKHWCGCSEWSFFIHNVIFLHSNYQARLQFRFCQWISSVATVLRFWGMIVKDGLFP